MTRPWRRVRPPVEDHNAIRYEDPVAAIICTANSLSESTNNQQHTFKSIIFVTDDSSAQENESQMVDYNVLQNENPVTQQIFSASSLSESTINRHHGNSSVSENLTMGTKRSLHNCSTEVPTFLLTVPVENVGCHTSIAKVMAWNYDPTSSISYDWNIMDTKLPKKESESEQSWSSRDDEDI